MKKRVWTILFFYLVVVSHPAQSLQKGDFRFLVISDTHISNDAFKDERMMTFARLVGTQYMPDIDFLVNTGDVCSSVYKVYEPERPDHGYNRLEKAVKLHDELSVPYYLVMGNHDYKIDSDRDSDLPFSKDEINDMERLWTKTTGLKPFYSFRYKGWIFIILDSMHGRGEERFFGDDQLAWLKKELKTPEPVILFVHHPLKTDHFRLWSRPHRLISPEKEPEFFHLLKIHKNHIKGIFVGHGHRWVHDKLFETIQVYETASFGEDEKNMNAYTVTCHQNDSSAGVRKIRLDVNRFLTPFAVPK